MDNAMGAMLRAHRKANGLTQREVADAAGIDFTYLSKIENGRLRFPPSDATIERLAGIVGCEPLTLLEASGKLIKVRVEDLLRCRRIEAGSVRLLLALAEETVRVKMEMHRETIDAAQALSVIIEPIAAPPLARTEEGG